MTATKEQRVSLFLLTIVYLGFISLGMPDGLLGAAWPKMRQDFGLSLSDNWPLMALTTIGGAFAGFISGRVLARFGVGLVLAVSALLTAVSILAWACGSTWATLVIFALPLGLGSGSVDSGMNSFVAKNLTARHMNWLHAFWGVGVCTGTGILSTIFFCGGIWRTAYLTVGMLQLILTIIFFTTLKQWHTGKPEQTDDNNTEKQTSLWQTLKLKNAQQSLAMFILYAGIECNMGVWSASLLVTNRGWSPATAGTMLTLYWASLTVGRFLLGAIANRLGNQRLIWVGCVGLALGATILLISRFFATPTDGILVAVAMLVTGFFCAPIYPCVMHDTPNRVPENHVSNLIGMQVSTAIIGMALMPIIGGFILKHIGLESLAPIVLACAILLACQTITLRRNCKN